MNSYNFAVITQEVDQSNTEIVSATNYQYKPRPDRSNDRTGPAPGSVVICKYYNVLNYDKY